MTDELLHFLHWLDHGKQPLPSQTRYLMAAQKKRLVEQDEHQRFVLTLAGMDVLSERGCPMTESGVLTKDLRDPGTDTVFPQGTSVNIHEETGSAIRGTLTYRCTIGGSTFVIPARNITKGNRDEV